MQLFTKPRLKNQDALSNYLQAADIFQDLPPDEIHTIEQHITMRTYPKGQILYAQDDRAETLFLLKYGAVHLYRLTNTGKRLEIAVLGPGVFFGEMPLLGESLRCAFAEVTEPALVCALSRRDIEYIIQQQPQVALRMIEAMGKRLAIHEERLEELAYYTIPARIASALLRLSQYGANPVIALTHQQLADLVGALRETVTAILNTFQRDGLVLLRRGKILVKNCDGLRSQIF